MTLSLQFATILTLILCGIVIGAIFEVYKQLFRPTYHANRFVVDSLFCVLIGVWLYYVLFQLNGGALRFYFIIALALGISTYFALFQTLFLRILAYFLNFLSTFFRIMSELINGLIIRPFLWIFRVMTGLVSFILRVMWQLLYGLVRLLNLIVGPFVPRIVKKYLKQWANSCDNRLRVMWKNLGLIKKKRRRASDVQEKEIDGQR